MSALTPAQMLAEIRKGAWQPVYLITGKEKFFQDQIIRALDKKLFPDPGAKSLNRIILQGTEAGLPDIAGAAMSYPMLSDHKLVLVKDFHKVSVSDMDVFLKYLENPQPATVLVLIADGKGAVVSSIASKVVKVDCKPITDWKIQEWIIARIKERQRTFSPDAVAAFSDYVGTDLLMIENELDKLINFKPEGEIGLDDVLAATGMSREYNVFALQDALAQRNLSASLKIATELLNHGENINMLLVILFGFFRKLSLYAALKASGGTHSFTKELGVREFQLKKMNAALRTFNARQLQTVLRNIQEADWKSKSSGEKPRTLMQTLCYGICKA